MIEFKNVSKRFKDVTVLKDITFEIEEGKLVVLIGLSGCGKTTTLKMINRLIKPTTGSITINGEDISKKNLIELRRNIGYVIQQTGLFPHMTIRENMEIIPRVEKLDNDKINKKTLELMEMVGLDEELLDRYPTELSGGQQQRLCIARALAVQPEVILMDEPTSALDPISTSKIEDLVIDLKKDYTIIMVTHNMQQATRVSDKTVFFLLGEIIESGETEKLFSMPVDKRTEDYITGRFG